MFNTAEALPAQVNIYYSIDIPTKKRVAWGGAASPEESGACGGVHLYLLSGPWVFLRLVTVRLALQSLQKVTRGQSLGTTFLNLKSFSHY
jgi:hypothetical protein